MKQFCQMSLNLKKKTWENINKGPVFLIYSLFFQMNKKKINQSNRKQKQARDSNGQFSGKEIQVVNKHL